MLNNPVFLYFFIYYRSWRMDWWFTLTKV